MDYVLDLRKNGSNFAILANSRSKEYSVEVQNNALPEELKKQFAAVYEYIFQTAFPEEGNTLLIRYQNELFKKVFTPSIVRGNPEHSIANDPGLLYIRWGQQFAPVYLREKKEGNKTVLYLNLEQGNDDSSLDYSIESYNFHGDGENYLDPALVINFIDEKDDSYTMPLAIRVVAETTDTTTRPDFANILKIAAKRGAEAFINKISPVVEFGTLPECVDFTSLPMMEAIAIAGKESFVSKAGKQITKLFVQTSKGLTQVWCPYSLVNYVNSPDFKATEKTPYLAVYMENIVSTNIITGVDYTNPVVAIENGALGKFSLFTYPVGTKINKTVAADFYALSDEKVLSQYRYQQTISDRDLEVGVSYGFIGYETVNTKQGTQAYRMTLVHPVTKAMLKVWCPNSLIPTLKLNPKITPETPSDFKVLGFRPNRAGDKFYAESTIGLNPQALPDKQFSLFT